MRHNDVPELDALFRTGSQTGAIMRTIDWSSTPLGNPQGWPQSLRSTLSICVSTPFPTAIYWGPEHVLLYNDAWIPISADRHPSALGSSAKKVWAEIWDIVEPQFDRVMNGEAISGNNEQLPIFQYGSFQECYFDYTMSPVRGEDGRVVGIFNPAIETTWRVLAKRRNQLLRKLAAGLAFAETPEQVCAMAAEILGSASNDVPFCVTYLVDHNHRRARRVGVTGFAENDPACPTEIDLVDQDSRCPWPFEPAYKTQHLQIVSDLQTKIAGSIPGGNWREPAHTAVVLAVPPRAPNSFPAAILVLGVSAGRTFDEHYASFFSVAAQSIGDAIAQVTVRDRKRLDLQARLANIANATPVAICELRIDGRGNFSMPFSTPAIAGIYGWSPEEVATDYARVVARIHPDDLVRTRASFAEARQTRSVFHAEFRVQHPQKGEIWVECRCTPAEPQADDSMVWYGYLHDITHRRRMEQRLRESEARLEKRVAERTAALAEANRDLESFAGTISHDLRAPLRSINAFSRLLLERERGDFSADDRRMLERIAASGRRLESLINEVLEYSRAGQLQMVRRPVSLTQLVTEITRELQPQFPQSQVAIAEMPEVEGDPTMLRQVLQNLISNALKFSSRESTPIIELGSYEEHGALVYFVRDNGVGFDMQRAEKLFSMFRRMHSAAEFPGTGVGLAIVRRLIERHGGKIWVDSAAGKGTTFFFTLPAHTDRDSADSTLHTARVTPH